MIYVPQGKRDAVSRELKKLEKQDGLTAPVIVDSARSPGSPLHEFFEWDDEKASDHYRLQQARELIRSVTVQMVDVEVPAYFNVTVTTGEEKKRRYFNYERVLKDEDLTNQVLEQAAQEARYFAEKYHHLKEAFQIINMDALERVEKKIKRK